MVKGFICERTGERLAFEDCLDCAMSRVNRKLDCPYDEATIFGMIAYQEVRDGISVTMISGCHRAVFLSRHYDYYVRPSQAYWAFRGQIAHKVCQEMELQRDAIKEQRFSREWEGIEISGRPDLILPSQKVLKDYKTTKTVPSYLNKDGQILAYENHRVQTNLYKWLVPYPIETLEVVYFSMDQTLICPVEIWPEEAQKKAELTVDRYLVKELIPLKMALDSGTLPPYRRTWLCDGYCDLKEICFRELKQEITAARLRVVKPKKKGVKRNGKDSSLKAGGADLAA